MPSEENAPGALLVCRAPADSVAPVAHLLNEPMLLTAAGQEWSVLVPEGRPWSDGAEPVDRVATGWATALAVGAPWPVLALWWDADRVGYTLAVGFRRPVGYVWLTDGTPVGEDEAMRTFAARLGLDPVLDVQSLDRLAAPDSEADARARLLGLVAILSRTGVALPAGLTPGASSAELSAAARALPDVRQIDWATLRRTARTELEAVQEGPLGPYLPWSGRPEARLLALAEVVAGLPLVVHGLRRRRAGLLSAGALLLAHGALGLSYGLTLPRD
ncbi:hypothetical protein [Streptomyces sp. NPDC088789]|uniref:hypothetical protein n=1 Tax=Streptomyces sp. NPDC088789 TaxID=3365899 RepID=UPI0037F775A3